MNQISEIKKFEGHDVRLVSHKGEPWWVLADVCEVLELSNPTESSKRLDEDELTSVKLSSGGQTREFLAVNEFGLYSLILRSNKPNAKKFKRWVTHEVLPAIARRNKYIAPSHKTFKRETKALKDQLDIWDLTEDETEFRRLEDKIRVLFTKIIQSKKQEETKNE